MKTFEVKSQSNPNVTYEVTYDEDSYRWTCDCPYTPRKSGPRHCKHILQCQAEMIAAGETDVQTARGPALPFGTEELEPSREELAQVQPPTVTIEAVDPDYTADDATFTPANPAEFAEALSQAPDAAIAVKDVETAILAVYEDVAFVQKQYADALKYSFAGEAQILAALRPSMVRHGLTARVEKVSKVKTREYQTKNQTFMTNTSLELKVRFTHAPTGSYVFAVARGEGSDAGDKSTPKALTGAFKYVFRQTFALETGDDPDQHSSRDMERNRPTEREMRQARRDVVSRAGQQSEDTPPWWQWFIKERNSIGIGGKDLELILAKNAGPANVRDYLNEELDRQELEVTQENVTKVLEGLLKKAADRKAAGQS